MSNRTACCAFERYCQRCDTLLGLPGLRVTDVTRGDDSELLITAESKATIMGCPGCGVVAQGHGRQAVELVDVPCFADRVRLCWVKRRWRCNEPACSVSTFIEQNPQIAAPRTRLTRRAISWAISQLRFEHASVQGLARQLGCAWKTLWRSIEPVLEAAAADESRFTGVKILGVDEHRWHHGTPLPVCLGGKGPKEFTGMVDLTPDQHGHTRARLLDLVPGRSGTVFACWLKTRSPEFCAGIQIATLDLFQGYKNAIDDHLEDTVAVLDAFHVVKLAITMVDQVRRRIQQETCGHRGRKHDPLYRIRNLLRASIERLTPRQEDRLIEVFDAREEHLQVEVAWHCMQELRAAYQQRDHAKGRRIAKHILATLPSCPIPEIARLGRTLNRWRDAYLAYFTTNGANNGGTEAVNGLIELARRIARDYRNPHNYRLRMLLTAGGITP